MNSSNKKSSILLGVLPSKDTADFLHIMPFARNKGILLGMAVMLITLIAIALHMETSFGDLDGSDSKEGLFALVNFTFNSAWLLGWSLGTLLFLYIFLVALFGQGTVLIYDGKLEINIGIAFVNLGSRTPLSEVVSVELVDVKERSIFANGGKALLVISEGKNKNSPIGGNFTTQDLMKLKSALALSKNIDAELEPIKSKDSKDIQQAETNNPDKSSLWALILVNLIPLFGVYFLGWKLGEIMVLYWAETLILSFYQSIRNIAVSPIIGLIRSLFNSMQIIIVAAFHFLFIWLIFIQSFWTDSSGIDGSLATVFNYIASLWPTLLGLFISHGYSLFIHFFNNPHADQTQLTVNPIFFRIIIMQIIVILGGILALITNSHWATLLLLVLLKTIADAKAHSKEHNLEI